MPLTFIVQEHTFIAVSTDYEVLEVSPQAHPKSDCGKHW